MLSHHLPPSTPDARFDNVHIDLVGPLPLSNGCVFTQCVDSFTQWLEAIPIADGSTDTVVKAFIQTWVSCSALGICTTLKEDLKCTVAKLVYGTSLHRQGVYIVPHNASEVDPVHRLKGTMRALRCTPTRHLSQLRCHTDNSLSSALHVFVPHWSSLITDLTLSLTGLTVFTLLPHRHRLH